MTEEGPDPRVIQLIMELRHQGIQDTRVLSAIERVPRDLFVMDQFQKHAFDNIALPITQGQTISQPYVVAFMTEALKLNDRCKVLEVGTGSGYQTAILARLCRRVYTIERYRSLLLQAERRFAELGINNITAKLGDGNKGWAEQAPFDEPMLAVRVSGDEFYFYCLRVTEPLLRAMATKTEAGSVTDVLRLCRWRPDLNESEGLSFLFADD